MSEKFKSYHSPRDVIRWQKNKATWTDENHAIITNACRSNWDEVTLTVEDLGERELVFYDPTKRGIDAYSGRKMMPAVALIVSVRIGDQVGTASYVTEKATENKRWGVQEWYTEISVNGHTELLAEAAYNAGDASMQLPTIQSYV